MLFSMVLNAQQVFFLAGERRGQKHHLAKDGQEMTFTRRFLRLPKSSENREVSLFGISRGSSTQRWNLAIFAEQNVLLQGSLEMGGNRHQLT